MKISAFLFACLFFSQFLFAQDKPDEKKENWGIKFSGFVKSDYWYDSRQIVGSREDIFLFFPKSVLSDSNGVDINARPSYNFSPVTSRLTGNISGPDAFGAKTSGQIEADFSGVSNPDNNSLRLRHAYVKLMWEKNEILFGQYWHPLFTPDVFPSVISLNTGAPFQPFNRSPQITFTHKKNNLNIIVSAISQRDFTSLGPQDRNPIYSRYSLIPNLHLQLQYKTDKQVVGVACDYKWLTPMIKTDLNFYTTETIGTYAFMAYYKHNLKNGSVKFKAIYGQNLSDHLMTGGYAVAAIDTVTHIATYTPTNNLFAWANFNYGEKIKPGLFVGYSQNFGTTGDNVNVYYALGNDIAYLYRISPYVSFVSGKFQISSEFEYTVAAYGTPDVRGIVQDTKEISNMRLLLTAFYFF